MATILDNSPETINDIATSATDKYFDVNKDKFVNMNSDEFIQFYIRVLNSAREVVSRELYLSSKKQEEATKLSF